MSKFIQMSKTIINLLFFLVELTFAFLFGIIARRFSEIYFLNISFSYLLIINYLFSIIGIAVPGFYYLKLYNNRKIFIAALLSSLIFILFGFILFILLGALNFSIVGFEYSGLIIPLLLGVIGFNIFAFKIKPL